MRKWGIAKSEKNAKPNPIYLKQRYLSSELAGCISNTYGRCNRASKNTLKYFYRKLVIKWSLSLMTDKYFMGIGTISVVSHVFLTY